MISVEIETRPNARLPQVFAFVEIDSINVEEAISKRSVTNIGGPKLRTVSQRVGVLVKRSHLA